MSLRTSRKMITDLISRALPYPISKKQEPRGGGAKARGEDTVSTEPLLPPRITSGLRFRGDAKDTISHCETIYL